MSQQSTSIHPSTMGCELPEHLRQYYLDVMGIDCWKQQEGFAPTVEDKSPAESSSQQDQAADNTNINQQWLELEQAVTGCEKCEALCASRTKTVFGSGSRQAELLVIGEAPGADEDKQGEPFVGPAGKLLTAMLKGIKLEREEVYIANIIKCRSPDDRDPLALEAENCSAYLRQQIALIQPKAILAVGRVAAQNLLSTDTAIGKLRGQSYEVDGIPVIVTYHPAYLLRKPSEKRKSWQDLLRLQELMVSWQ